ncbi:MAG: hypothetical protein U0Q22_17850 [Acidimicrobiales bacterium]
MAALPERIAAAVAEREDIEAEIAQLAVEFEALPPAEDTSSGRRPEGAHLAAHAAPSNGATATAAVSSEVEELRRRVAEAEARVQAHERAVAEIAATEAHHAVVEQRARELQSAIQDNESKLATLRDQRVAARNRLRTVEAARSASDAARREVRQKAGDSQFVDGSAGAEAVEWYVLARLAQQRSVSFVGSVPLVIDDAFVNWPIEALADVFNRLERMGEVIQIVYLTDDPDVGAWARGLGSDRALVLDMRVAQA